MLRRRIFIVTETDKVGGNGRPRQASTTINFQKRALVCKRRLTDSGHNCQLRARALMKSTDTGVGLYAWPKCKYVAYGQADSLIRASEVEERCRKRLYMYVTFT